MTTRTGGAVQASVSVEDISRQYYESAGYSMWITAMHVDPLELIANDDASGKAYRIPVELSGDTFTFGEAQEVAITYVDVKSAAAAKIPHRWGSKAAALAAAGKSPDGTDLKPPVTQPEGEPIADDVTPAGAAIRKMASTTKTPDAVTATGQPDNTEEASVDAAKMREALGLSADATDAEVTAAFAAATPAPQTPTGEADPASLLAAIPEGSGAIVLDRENYKALLARASKGEQAFEAMERNERDSYLTKACEEGRFPVARLDAYKTMWDANPKGTKEFVALMPKNSVPTMSVGFLGAEINLNEADMAYEAMYGKAGA